MGNKASKRLQASDLRQEHIIENSRLQKADHIAVLDTIIGQDYYHHGIYLGGQLVIHLSGQTPEDATIKKCDLTTFADNRDLIRVVYDKGLAKSSKKVVKTARELLKHPDRFGNYHLLNNNCEHFATFCKTGQAFSVQVDKLQNVVVDVATTVADVARRGAAAVSGSGPAIAASQRVTAASGSLGSLFGSR